jgi:hypothetical protein
MNEAQIKHLVDRFLNWRLPKDFRPDNGISYKRPNYMPEVDATPVGTNLFGAAQATEMVRHMIEGLPDCAPALRAEGAQAVAWSSKAPTIPGVYVWRDPPRVHGVLVHKRPSEREPGGVLKGSVLEPSKFYEGCAIEKWQGEWFGPISADGAISPPAAPTEAEERALAIAAYGADSDVLSCERKGYIAGYIAGRAQLRGGGK